jgi:hypothetical protein
MGSQELGQRTEAALQKAQVAATALEGVYPQTVRPVGDSPYLQKPTVLALKGVTLRQLTSFLVALTDGSGLTVKDLRLRIPHGDAARDLWDAEVTLTCLIYEPPAKPKPGGRGGGGSKAGKAGAVPQVGDSV